MRAISLFSGAGGLDLGLRQAGIKTLSSIEVDLHCANTLARNFRSKILCADIRCLNPKAVLDTIGTSDIEVLHGGPPCQPFSQIGTKKGLDHPDGNLIFEYLKWAQELKPQFIILEQVKGFLSQEHLYELFKTRLRRLGYVVEEHLVNSLDYGVAQIRHRIILLGQLNVAASIPLAGRKRKETVRSVIGDLPAPSKNSANNHVDVTPDRDKERISYVSEGEWLAKSRAPKSIILNLKKKDTTKFRRLAFDSPSLTLRCGEIFYHPTQDRYLTPREYLRLHGYPDNFVLTGPIRARTGQVTNLDQHRQVANSVPPPLAKSIGQAIKKMEKKWPK